ncbi:Hint domain-containing protein [Pseudooceanicola pacificus]|nr:Hint domain-containing protein [Pseudooceanicola pacificus]
MTFSPRAIEHDAAKQVPAKRRMPMMRRYEIQTLDSEGRDQLTQHIAPATTEFESAFNAFARGTGIMTDSGPRAIEDLRPGMRVETLEHGQMQVRWIGSMTMVPNAPGATPEQCRLTRVTSDRFGPGRPGIDLTVGPGARMLHRPDALRRATSGAETYTPLDEFVDCDCVFQITPPAPVETYHICLDRHATIYAEGLGVETYHPGYHLEEQMGPNMLALFLSLFPHIRELEDFGLLVHPRMTLRALHDLHAA